MSAPRNVRDVGLSTLLRFRWGAAATCLVIGLSGIVPGLTNAGRLVGSIAVCIGLSIAVMAIYALLH